jgi:uncharacterized membrane protein
MPSTELSQWVPNLLCLITFQLGICLVLLADIANATRGYGLLITLAGSVIGVLMAASALQRVIEYVSHPLHSDFDCFISRLSRGNTIFSFLFKKEKAKYSG